MVEQERVELRRREFTRTFVRYFLVGFFVIVLFSGVSVFSIIKQANWQSGAHARAMKYCLAVEALKAQNREDVSVEIKNYTRNLALLGVKDTPALRAAATEEWARKLNENKAVSCPYHA